MVGIYKIQSVIKPNRIYIGSSVSIGNRWQKHILRLVSNKHENSKLQRHYNKYGISDLYFSVILECSLEDLISTEQYFIDTCKPYFNVCKVAGNSLGYKHTEKTKKKMRGPKSEDHKRKLSLARKGKAPWNKGRHDLPPQSKETRLKKSIALRGKPKPRPAAKK